MLAEEAEGELLELSPEELRRLGEAMADALLASPGAAEAAAACYACVRVYAAVEVEAELIDLEAMASSTHGIMDILGQIAGWFRDLLNSVASWIVAAIQGFIGGIVDTVKGVVAGVATAVRDFISAAASTIVGAVGGAVSTLASLISAAVSGAASAVMAAISAAISAVSAAISAVASAVSAAVAGAVSALSAALSAAASALMSAISAAASSLSAAVSGAASAILSAVSNFVGLVSAAVSTAARWIWDGLSAAARWIMDGLAFVHRVLSDALSAAARWIMDGLAGVGRFLEGLWRSIVSAFESMAAKVGAGFDLIGRAVMGFVNSIAQVGGWLLDALRRLGEWIWSALPEWLRDALTSVGAFFRDLAKAAADFIKDPLGWLSTNVVAAVRGWVDAFWSAAQEAARWVLGALKAAAAAMWDAVSGLVSLLGDLVARGLESLFSLFVRRGSPTLAFAFPAMEAFVHSVYDPTVDSTAKLAGDIVRPAYEEAVGVFRPPLKVDEAVRQTVHLAALSIGVLTLPFWGQIPVRLGAWVMKAVAKWLSGLSWAVRINLRPLGIGVDTQFDFAKAFGSTLYDVSESLKQWLDEVGRGLIYGFAIWFSRPIAKVLNMTLRNFIPVELPREELLVEALRRHMPLAEFEDRRRLISYFLGVHGYSDRIVDMWTRPAEELNVKVRDRFGAERLIPLSLMYELPSASDVARMAIRDVFGMGREAVDSFLKVYSARGMHEDVGVLYYLLHYRYPPPERLWAFTVRGWAGMLWATIPSEMLPAIRAEAERLKAALPTSAAEWNFKARELYAALQTYMTWHDHARFSWMRKELFGWDKDFTSDNQIVVDTLADIPTKIDQRWMVKWGLYEHLSARNVGISSPVRDFALRVLDPSPASEVRMDLVNFSRSLLATGLHPDWVPVTAVAEAMNALTEERTLLRAGFLGLFKEGFYGVEALEAMLAGFVVASFHVSYFDMSRMEWTTGWVNLPVMFLPPERRLLELRALMDRALDVLREVQRDASRAYQEHVVRDYNEYRAKMEQVVSAVNEFYARDYRAITGVELPPQLRLSFVEEYYRPYVAALQVMREVYTLRRVRSWTMRWMGWLMYRAAYGVVEKEDVERLASIVVRRAKLTDYEAEFLREVLEAMYMIARRESASEYLPTPSTLATLSEYVALDPSLVGAVLERRGIPAEWQAAWLTYIAVRPIKADARSLLSAYVRAFRQGVVSRADLEAYVKELPAYGFTPREVEFISRAVELEEAVLEARASRGEYVPTPLTLASICEHLPEARRYLEAVVKAKRIPAEWQPLWARYLDVRPLVDDVRRYVSRAEALYARFMVRADDFRRVVEEANAYLGYTPKEVEFLMKVTEFERYRHAWTELIGSVERLVSLSEYSPRASRYALGKLREMIDALPLSPAEKAELKEMWEEYIRNRPVKAEARTYVTQLINLYVEGLIDRAAFHRELDEMKKWGFSDDELMFYKAQAELRKMRKLKVPVVA